jgi:simple sugar transport system ATP-binding protein
LDRRTASRRILALSEQYGLAVEPDALIADLPVGIQQRVEIIKTLYRDAEILILDEPTAVLTPQETEELFEIMRGLVEKGKSIIFITHKLKEVMTIADRVVVLRDGRVAGETTPADSSEEELAEMMVGREVKLAPDKPETEVGPAALEISGLRVIGDRGNVVIDDLDLEVHTGEILGIAGVSGNGQRELAETIAGLRQAESGSIVIAGSDVTNQTPAGVRSAGLAYVPEGRMKDGSIGPFTVAENLLLIDHNSKEFLDAGLLNFEAIRKHSQSLVDEFAVKTPSLDTPVRSLSGGNIQKLILARELSGTPNVLVASQPTRGVDIGAAEYIHIRLIEQRDQSTAILMISEDLDEIFGLSDRVAVMYEGKIMGIVRTMAENMSRNIPRMM